MLFWRGRKWCHVRPTWGRRRLKWPTGEMGNMKASPIEERSPIGAGNLETTDHKSWWQWKGCGKISKVPGHPTHVQLVRPTYIQAQGRMPELRARGTRGTDLWHWQWLRVRRLRRKRCRKTLWMMHVCGGMLQKTPTNDDTLCDKRRKCV